MFNESFNVWEKWHCYSSLIWIIRVHRCIELVECRLTTHTRLLAHGLWWRNNSRRIWRRKRNTCPLQLPKKAYSNQLGFFFFYRIHFLFFFSPCLCAPKKWTPTFLIRRSSHAQEKYKRRQEQRWRNQKKKRKVWYRNAFPVNHQFSSFFFFFFGEDEY